MKKAILAIMTVALLVGVSTTANAAIILSINSATTPVAAGGSGTFTIQAVNDATFTSFGYSVGITTTNNDLTFTTVVVSGVSYIHTDNTGFDNSAIAGGGFSDSLASSESVVAGTFTLATVTFSIASGAATGTAVLDFDLLVSLFDDGTPSGLAPTSAGPVTINIIGAAAGVPEPATVGLGLTAMMAVVGLGWRRRRLRLAA